MKDILISVIGNDPSILSLLIKLVIFAFFILLACIAKKVNTNLGIRIYKDILTQIENIIESIVIYMNQTLVDDLKNKNNGKLTTDQIEYITEQVHLLVEKSLNVEQRKILEEFYPDINTAVQILVEKFVKYHKNSTFTLPDYTDTTESLINETINSIEVVANDTSDEAVSEEVVEEKPKKKRTRKTKKEETTEEVSK